MDGHNINGVISRIKSYTTKFADGDLIALAEIKESFEELIDSISDERELQEILLPIPSIIESISQKTNQKQYIKKLKKTTDTIENYLTIEPYEREREREKERETIMNLKILLQNFYQKTTTLLNR